MNKNTSKNIIFSTVLGLVIQNNPVQADQKDISNTVWEILSTQCWENIQSPLNYNGQWLQSYIIETFWVKIEDCILNNLAEIKNIENLLLEFYGKNNPQIFIDFKQNSLHILEIFTNPYLLQDILNYHLQFPDIQKTVKNYDLYVQIFHNKNKIYDITIEIQKINSEKQISHQLINLIEILTSDVNAYEKYIPKIQYLSEIWYKLPFYYIQWEKTNYSNIFWNISELYYLVNSWYIYNFLEKKNKIIQNNFTNYFEWINLYNAQPLEDISKSNNSEKLDEILYIKKLFDEINQKISFIWIIKILQTNTFSDIKNIFLYLKNLEPEKQNKIIKTLHIKNISDITNQEDLEKIISPKQSIENSTFWEIYNTISSKKYSEILNHKNIIITSDEPWFYLSNMQELIKIYNLWYNQDLLYLLNNINKPIFIHGINELFSKKISINPYKEIKLNNEEFKKSLNRLIIYINNNQQLESSELDQKLKFKQIIYDINSWRNIDKILKILWLFKSQINSMQQVIELFNDEKYNIYLDDKNFHDYIEKYNLLNQNQNQNENENQNEKIHINQIWFIYKMYKKNTSLEMLKKDRLKQLITNKLEEKRIVHRIDSNGINYDNYTIKKLDNFSTLELLELLYFINALESKEIKDSVIKLLKNDYNNTNSEIWWKIQINTNNEIVIQPFSSESKNDWTYLPTKDFYNNDLDYNYHFHIHGVKNMRNNMYAGPSLMDLLNNSYNQKISIVITRINDKSYNIDLYKAMDTVIDLWIYTKK